MTLLWYASSFLLLFLSAVRVTALRYGEQCDATPLYRYKIFLYVVCLFAAAAFEIVNYDIKTMLQAVKIKVKLLITFHFFYMNIIIVVRRNNMLQKKFDLAIR